MNFSKVQGSKDVVVIVELCSFLGNRLYLHKYKIIVNCRCKAKRDCEEEFSYTITDYFK